MFYMPALVSSVLTTAFLCIASAATDSPGAKEAQTFFPTIVGTKWVYERDQIEEIRVITSVEKKATAIVANIGRLSGKGKVIPLERLRLSEKDCSRLSGDSSTLDPPVVLLKLPPRTGDKWNYVLPRIGFFPEEEGTMLVYEPEEVKVPAGKFTAVRVVASATVLRGTILMVPAQTTFWYAPGVGLVKSMDNKKRTTVLKSFTPSKE